MMIGPSAGNSEGMQNRDVTELSGMRIKRKVFEDLDIDSFCDDGCQSGKKRNDTCFTELCGNVNSESFSGNGEKPAISYINGLSPIPFEEYSNSGSVARLEVLVVDSTWEDSSNLTNHHPTVINSSAFPDMQSLDNYAPYWENAMTLPNVHSVNHAPEILSPSLPVEDQENGNLSWLLDFKLDSLIEAPVDKCSPLIQRESQNGINANNNRFTANSKSTSSTGSYLHEIRKPYPHLTTSTGNNLGNIQSTELTSSTSNNYGMVNDSRNFSANRYNGPKKPPFTYTELIEHALQEKGELTVSAIYQWISEHFPYYKSNDDRWKNSVRHNLSINPHFRKGSKAPHGAGHLWAIANRGDTRPRQSTSSMSVTTTRQVLKTASDNNYRKNGSHLRSQLVNQVITMDEVAAATASIQQPDDNAGIINSITLEHCAEQILSGIKREVEVQYLVPMARPDNVELNSGHENNQNDQAEQHLHQKETDFLNPVSKEVVAEECGLIGEGYLVTDLNPTALGLNMVEPETMAPDLFGEELSFQFYELTSPSQLQSA